jgi:hypothetical protein
MKKMNNLNIINNHYFYVDLFINVKKINLFSSSYRLHLSKSNNQNLMDESEQSIYYLFI